MKSLLLNPYTQTITEVDTQTDEIARALMDSLTPSREILANGDLLITDSREMLDTSRNCYGAMVGGAFAFGFALIIPGHGDTLSTPADIDVTWIEGASQAREMIETNYF